MDDTAISKPPDGETAFRLNDRVAVITGGAGKLGKQFASAILGAGGIPVLLDVDGERLQQACASLGDLRSGAEIVGIECDITLPENVELACNRIMAAHDRVDILINNAANNPHFGDTNKEATERHLSRLESFPLSVWNEDLAVSLTGAFLCSKVFGTVMSAQRKGVILNIASDLSIIAPDQRLYEQPGLPEQSQFVKPVSYSVVKSGIVGLTRYLSTYWAHRGVRANALSFGGVYSSDMDDAFVKRITDLIPLKRMANLGEYNATVLYMVSDASLFMNGANVVLDGGRTAW